MEKKTGNGYNKEKRETGAGNDTRRRRIGDKSYKPASINSASGDRQKNKIGAGGRPVRKETVAGRDTPKKRFDSDTDKTKKRLTPQSKPVKKETDKKDTAEELIRLNRYISNSGVCGRREADDLISRGLIEVNGKKVTELGTKVSRDDKVTYNGKKLEIETKVYVLLNKPKGYVTTVKDPHAEFTVLDLVKDATNERIYPVGRLDKSTTGVLLLTNDGDLAAKLTHPKYGAKKVYHVFLDHEVTKNDMETVVSGVELEDGIISADAISFPEPEDRTQVGIEIHSGQNRIVRRIFEKLGYDVRKLDRVFFAGLTKKNIPRGTWRHLTPKEVNMLKRGIFS